MSISRLARREGPALVAALLACACATSEPTHSAPVEVRDESGFTISQDVHAGAGVRGDFASAVRLLEEERYAEGIPLLQQVAESAPDATTVFIDLGIAYGKVGDLEHAEASLEKALELNPRHPVARNELAIVYRRTGRFADARASYEQALAAYPEFHFARLNLAILCDVYLADLGCAMKNYELYTQAVPTDETAAMWIADLRNRMAKK